MCGSELVGLPTGVGRVSEALQEGGHTAGLTMLKEPARTALEAAAALGVFLGQIAKSIVFRRSVDDLAVLVITSGDRRVDQEKVAGLVGPVGRVDAIFVKAKTGFPIGGVAPVGLATKCITLIDQELFRYPLVWLAAGDPNAVFSIEPEQLVALTQAPSVDVTLCPLVQSICR